MGGCSDQTSTSIKNKGKTFLSKSVKTRKQVIQQKSLYTIIDKNKLAVQGNKYLSVIQKQPTTAVVHIARLSDNPGQFLNRGKGISIPVSHSKKFIVNVTAIKKHAAGDISWKGSLKKRKGRAGFVLGPDGITGTLHEDSLLYKFEPIGNRLQAIIKENQSKIQPEHPSKFPSGALIDTATASMVSKNSFKIKNNSEPNPRYIDVLVVYTPSAANMVYDINNLIQLAIDETNSSYENSNIDGQLRLVKTAEVNYDEAGHTYEDYVDAMEYPFDGIGRKIDSLRNEYLADVAVMIVNDNTYCGLADAIKATRNTAFAAVDWRCTTGYYSFGHEIGHLQGARHNIESDPTLTPFKYGHGYIAPNKNWRTIMGEPGICNYCMRIQYWSSPYVNYSGIPTGKNPYAWNVWVLSHTRKEIRDFETLPAPTNIHIINSGSFGESPKIRWTPSPNANLSTVYRCKTKSGPSTSCFEPILVTGGNGINDWNITMQNPANGCKKKAYYYVTNQNSTGESFPSLKVSICMEN
jgi:hypothetical protein